MSLFVRLVLWYLVLSFSAAAFYIGFVEIGAWRIRRRRGAK